MFNNGSPSLADIAAVTDRNNNGFGDMGGMGGWWVLIILLALFGGFGNGNWGNGGNNRNCDSGSTTVITVPTPGYGGGGMGYGFGFEVAGMQRGFDNSTVISKLDGISNGICNLGYDQLAQMNGIGSNIQQVGFGLQQAINQDTVANMQNTNALQALISNCCCETKGAIKDVQNEITQQTCAIRNEVHQTGDAIIQSQNWGFRNLQDTITQGFANMERQSEQRYIRQLEQQLNDCNRDKALQGMASYVVDQVRPSPRPSWRVPNPYAGCNCNYSDCAS